MEAIQCLNVQLQLNARSSTSTTTVTASLPVPREVAKDEESTASLNDEASATSASGAAGKAGTASAASAAGAAGKAGKADIPNTKEGAASSFSFFPNLFKDILDNHFEEEAKEKAKEKPLEKASMDAESVSGCVLHLWKIVVNSLASSRTVLHAT